MSTTVSKKKVKDIAALFGETIAVKKVKTRSRILERRNSDILRRKREELRNTQASQLHDNDTDADFEDISLKNVTGSNLSSLQSAEKQIALRRPIYDDDDIDIIHPRSDIDIDQFINDTYGGWKQWSQSSYLSSINIDEYAPGENTRSSVCSESMDADDDDEDDEDDNDYEFGENIDENSNQRLSQQIISQIKTDNNPHFDCASLGKLKHLQEIGAIRTRDYLANQMMSDSNTIATNTPNTPNLFGADPDYISSDSAIDSSADDDDEYIDSELIEDEFDVMDLISIEEDDDIQTDTITVDDLLTRFGIYAFSEDYNIYRYMHQTLGIRYCGEMIDISPIKIRKPDHCKKFKTLMKLHKMCKYVSRRVINGEWTGRKRKEWIDLEANSVFYVFQYKARIMHVYDDKKTERKDNVRSVTLSGCKKKYFAYVTTNALNDRDIMSFKVITQQLPDLYESAMIKIGVECNDESVYITDRLIIRHNDNYVHSMFVGKFVENGSEIIVKLTSDDSECLNVNLCHNPRTQQTVFDHNTFSKDFKIRMDVNCCTLIKLFIEQYRGHGVYQCA